MTSHGDDHRRYTEFGGATTGQIAAEGNGAQDCQNRSARAADQVTQQVGVRADEARPSVGSVAWSGCGSRVAQAVSAP